MSFLQGYMDAQQLQQQRQAYHDQQAQQALQDTLTRYKIQDAVKNYQDQQDPNSIYNQTEQAKLDQTKAGTEAQKAHASYWNNADIRDINAANKNDILQTKNEAAAKLGEQKATDAAFTGYLGQGYSPTAAGALSHKVISPDEQKAMVADSLSSGLVSAYKNLPPDTVDKVKQFVGNTFGGGAWGQAIGQAAQGVIPSQMNKTPEELQQEAMSLPSPKFAEAVAKERSLSLYRQERTNIAGQRADAYVSDLMSREDFKQAAQEFQQKKFTYDQTIKNAKLGLERIRTQTGVKNANTAATNSVNAQKYREESLNIRKQTAGAFNHASQLMAGFTKLDGQFQGDIDAADAVLKAKYDQNGQESAAYKLNPKMFIDAEAKKAASENKLKTLRESSIYQDTATRYQDMQEMYKGLTDQGPTTATGKPKPAGATGGKTPDKAAMMQILKEAGMDVPKAKALARKRGYAVP